MDYGDQLPCGGFLKQDEQIKKNMKQLSQSQFTNQVQQQDKTQTNQKLQKSKCCTKQKKCCQGECKKIECYKQQQKLENVKQLQDHRKIALCKKCKTNQSVLIHKSDPICKDCLLKNIEYKCRLTLENSMKVKQDSSILICFSGGLNSICLVNILANLKKRYQKHHLFGELRCIHIQQQEKLPEGYVKNFQNITGLKLEIINIGQIFEEQKEKNNSQILIDIKKIFQMFNNAANTLDLLALFRDKLIVDYAKKNNFQFIVKGLNGQKIATQIFKYFAKGIGGDVTELASREDDSLFYFPLRQHLQKQLQYYFHTLKCNQISLKAQNDDLSNFCSQSLDIHLSQFLGDLQTMYSHTAPAITRTGQKIESNRLNDIRCRWCMLKGSSGTRQLCRKCQRMYQYKGKNFQMKILPKWMQFQE